MLNGKNEYSPGVKNMDLEGPNLQGLFYTKAYSVLPRARETQKYVVLFVLASRIVAFLQQPAKASRNIGAKVASDSENLKV